MESFLIDELRDLQKNDTRQSGFSVYACFFQLSQAEIREKK